MSIREELARKLANTVLARRGDLEPYDEVNVLYKQKWLSAADECLRQMEWQRFQQWNWRRDWHAGVPFKGREVPAPLTLAPTDWKP